MLCHFQTYIHSTKILCIKEDLSPILFTDFWKDVCSQANQICTLNGHEWALWENDSYEFLVLLFAGLLANKRIVIAPNRVKDLELDFADQGIYFLSRQEEQVLKGKYVPNELNFNDDFLNQSHVYFYTSGSTGQPKKIPRTLRQLLNEVVGLHESLNLPEVAIGIATVSHQHIYGLLFKLLLPLASGRSFYNSQVVFPEDVVNAQKKLSILKIQSYVISSPALLKRWTNDVLLQDCFSVYSSGGKLDSGIRPLINSSITEVLGSSETGGIAHRHEDEAFWVPFSNVDIRVTEHEELAVKTNHAFQEDWILTGDRAQAVQTENLKSPFRLLGRLDRIVKLEEKRLSLDAIEQKILTLNEVEQCHVTLIEHEHRQILACVAVLTVQARQQLLDSSKTTLVSKLKGILKEKLETIAIPRQWRFLTQLPQNAQSKLNKNDMKLMFETMLYPVVLGQSVKDEAHVFNLEFPPELECFKGHFPDYPIYPGVGQIAFIQHYAKQIWADLAWCSGYEQIKFQDLIRPYSILELRLHRQKNKVHFEMLIEDKVIASGRLLFEIMKHSENETTHTQVETS